MPPRNLDLPRGCAVSILAQVPREVGRSVSVHPTDRSCCRPSAECSSARIAYDYFGHVRLAKSWTLASPGLRKASSTPTSSEGRTSSPNEVRCDHGRRPLSDDDAARFRERLLVSGPIEKLRRAHRYPRCEEAAEG